MRLARGAPRHTTGSPSAFQRSIPPVRFAQSSRKGHDAWGRPDGTKPTVGVMDFYRVEGDEIHEVAVGPVHAGVIEPGADTFVFGLGVCQIFAAGIALIAAGARAVLLLCAFCCA